MVEERNMKKINIKKEFWHNNIVQWILFALPLVVLWGISFVMFIGSSFIFPKLNMSYETYSHIALLSFYLIIPVYYIIFKVVIWHDKRKEVGN
jgi:hypothetical protein